MRLPLALLNILLLNLEISLTLLSVLAILGAMVTMCYLVVRYIFLTRYSKNTTDEHTAPPVNNLVEQLNSKNIKKKKGVNYLDEFLSAIKIFGYLERPVFNELTKSMTTQKLSPDEILYLDESLGFSIVVEGVMQVYTKINANQETPSSELNFEKDDVLFLGNQRYQLLNEVKSGAPLSSLISTLDLFQSDKPRQFSPFGDLLSQNSTSSLSVNERKENSELEYPEIVARANPNEGSGATIAIIPRLAFQRVHRKYPKATSHIVTMVLMRLYKVTMSTTYHYLGLTKQIIETEMRLNEESKSNLLPSYLYNSIKKQSDASTSSLTSMRNSSSTNNEDPIKKNEHHDRPQHIVDRTSSRYVLLDSRTKASHPGDLLSSVPISRRSDYMSNSGTTDDYSQSKKHTRTDFSSEFEETEESSLRTAVVENMFKMLGISEAAAIGINTPEPMSPDESGMGLSRLVSDDHNIKFFNTVNQKQTEMPPLPSQTLPTALRRSSTPDLDFASIKKDFLSALQIKYVAPGTVLADEGSFSTGLYYVIQGSLDVSHSSNKLYSVEQGGLAGYLTSVLGFGSLVTVSVPKEAGAIVAHLRKDSISYLMDKYYFLLLPVATKLKSLLLHQLLTIDFALEWCHIPAGGVLCAQGDLANGFHIVLSGRFRVVRNNSLIKKEYPLSWIDDGSDKAEREKKDDIEILGEYGHGELIGEVEVLTALRRTNSLIAVRDSETARIPRTLFEMLLMQNPSLMVKISRIVAKEVTKRNLEHNPHLSGSPSSFISTNTSPYISNEYKTITIVPCNTGLPVVREFAEKLEQALKQIGRNVIALDRASTLSHLGRHAFDERLAHLKLSGYFAYLETQYETVLYVCDTPIKLNWTSTCISQGDCILFLADAEDDVVATGIGDYERLLLKLKTTARTDLCLLHSEQFVVSGSTSIWLKNRMWVQGHHHIQMEVPRRATKTDERPNIIRDLAAKILKKTNPHVTNVKNKAISSFLHARRFGDATEKIEPTSLKTSQLHKNDFLRLARILSNEAVGLVLGGGGSRGVSHVGVVTALEKHGIPIDLIGGTSIGSFVGGLYAKEYNIVSIYGRAKKFARRVASLWRSILDLTYPVTSYITGYEFNRGIWKIFGSSEIEDFWIRFFCNSTNITNSTMDIHESGYLWRFIRASMSLAGLLPPIAFKGCMLLDGGYLDNLPVMEMKKKGAKYIIAVDVGSADDRTPMDYGDTLSGFWVLFNRWNPFSKHPNPPNMMDIQMRLAYVASVNALNQAKNTLGVIYLRPPIDNYATLDFGKFDEIYHVGFAYADTLFTEWEQSGKIPAIAGMVDKLKLLDKRKTLYRRNSI